MNAILKNPSKILGTLLVLFGALQAVSEQVRTLVDPTAYLWYTLVIGIAVATLGALKRGEGSFLVANRTTIMGVVLVLLSAVQGASDQIRALVGESSFALFNIIVGVALAVLGFLNSQVSPPEDPPAG